MHNLEHAESVIVAATPEALYALVSDVTQMGRWSPICRACWWDQGDGPHVGAWFTGRNETLERTWETRSLVVAADEGREFAFQVLGSWVRWSFTFEAVEGGTRLTESWQVLPDGVAGYLERFGAEAGARMDLRRDQMRHGIPATLAAIKAAVEGSARLAPSPPPRLPS